MSMRLFEMKQDREALLIKSESIISTAEKAKRSFTDEEKTTLDSINLQVDALNPRIHAIEEQNTILATSVLAASGFAHRMPSVTALGPKLSVMAPTKDDPRAAQFRNEWASWIDGTLTAVSGIPPAMAATTPSGPVSVGSGTGLDSIGITVPTTILPYLASYFNLDSFGLAGATTFFTENTQPLVKPIISAGAADSTFAENAAPSSSQPFGLSGFTFGATKYSRLVTASYEALMNSELPLQGTILDELLASLATTLTTATTASMYAALSGASSTLEVGVGSGNDIYSSLIDLRYAVPPRFDSPSNKWMLSRATLATIKNKRASTSGVAMFDPTTNTIFDRPYVINDNFDAVCGAGFVAFGSWADGCWLRRTPVMTRVFQELYAQNGQIGYRTTQWADSHFLAELAGSAQPPSYQPLFYTSIASES